MVHRYVATGVGVLILVLAVAAWLAPVRVHPWWPTLTLVWVCIQGAFGALTVTMKLFPAIVTLHLLAGLVLLAMLCVQVMHRDEGQEGTVPVAVSPALRAMLWLGFGLVMLQAALGGWVSTNYAVLACSDFPRCQARWWPEMNFEQGFQIWRPLGFTQDGSYISFAALTAIHVVHRMMAAVVLLVMGLLAGWLNTVAGLRMASRWLAALIILQMATGLSNVVFSWPLVAAVLHTGGAAAMLIVITRILVATSTERSVAA
jgi:cytochrome c oxidase assembly protein subunit 15